MSFGVEGLDTGDHQPMNIMKGFILILSFFNISHAFAQTAGKKYTFQGIGWSIVLPGDFTAIRSADPSIQIQPGRKTDAQSLSKELLLAMADANTFEVKLTSCDSRDEDAGAVYSASNKRSYAVMSTGDGIKCDSATTTVSIDGVAFKRYRLTTKKNNIIQENYVALYTCYKGYAIYITLMYFSKKAGDELESMLADSKFSK